MNKPIRAALSGRALCVAMSCLKCQLERDGLASGVDFRNIKRRVAHAGVSNAGVPNAGHVRIRFTTFAASLCNAADSLLASAAIVNAFSKTLILSSRTKCGPFHVNIVRDECSTRLRLRVLRAIRRNSRLASNASRVNQTRTAHTTSAVCLVCKVRSGCVRLTISGRNCRHINGARNAKWSPL